MINHEIGDKNDFFYQSIIKLITMNVIDFLLPESKNFSNLQVKALVSVANQFEKIKQISDTQNLSNHFIIVATNLENTIGNYIQNYHILKEKNVKMYRKEKYLNDIESKIMYVA